MEFESNRSSVQILKRNWRKGVVELINRIQKIGVTNKWRVKYGYVVVCEEDWKNWADMKVEKTSVWLEIVGDIRERIIKRKKNLNITRKQIFGRMSRGFLECDVGSFYGRCFGIRQRVQVYFRFEYNDGLSRNNSRCNIIKNILRSPMWMKYKNTCINMVYPNNKAFKPRFK